MPLVAPSAPPPGKSSIKSNERRKRPFLAEAMRPPAASAADRAPRHPLRIAPNDPDEMSPASLRRCRRDPRRCCPPPAGKLPLIFLRCSAPAVLLLSLAEAVPLPSAAACSIFPALRLQAEKCPLWPLLRLRPVNPPSRATNAGKGPFWRRLCALLQHQPPTVRPGIRSGLRPMIRMKCPRHPSAAAAAIRAAADFSACRKTSPALLRCSAPAVLLLPLAEAVRCLQLLPRPCSLALLLLSLAEDMPQFDFLPLCRPSAAPPGKSSIKSKERRERPFLRHSPPFSVPAGGLFPASAAFSRSGGGCAAACRRYYSEYAYIVRFLTFSPYSCNALRRDPRKLSNFHQMEISQNSRRA